jgi:hypothetical protein
MLALKSLLSTFTLLTTFSALVTLTLTTTAALAKKSDPPKISNTVFLIRHGEKPDDGGNGLTAQGEERAECLVDVSGR